MKRLRESISSCLTLAVSVLIACASGPSTQREERAHKESVEALHRHERTFNPADYDPEIPFEVKEEKQEPEQSEQQPALVEEVETVSGFRVQVIFTDNIDHANTVKDEVALLVGDQNVHIVYEAPYYKVRVGDFLSRPEANETLNLLFQHGYKDSWIVPDKVKKRQP